jgi:hypothetical protein
MPAITKTQGKLALQHVLTNILEDKEDNGSPGHIERSLLKKGISGILDLNTISGDDIDSLQYEFKESDDSIVLKTLHKSQIGLLKSLRAYIFHKDVKGEIIDSHDKWMQLELEEFQCFRSSKEWFSISANPTQAFAPIGGKRVPDLVADFKKGIKRDANMFPSLKQDKQWDNWQRAVIAQA